ncbi:MAG: hypothetical protein AAGC55_30180, partial [Myxococcota bacterium]
ELLRSAEPKPIALVGHLSRTGAQVRRALYDHLAESPDPACIPALRAAVLGEGENDDLLAAGLDALAAHGDGAAITVARRLATGQPNKSRGVARAAWAYLAQVGALGDQPDQLRAVLRATLAHDGVRAAAMYTVALRRGDISGDDADRDLSAVMATRQTDEWSVQMPVLTEASAGLDSVQSEPTTGTAASAAFSAAAGLGRSRPLVELLKAIDAKRPGAEEALVHLDSPSLFRLILLVNARNVAARARRRIIRGLRRSDLPEVVEVAAQVLDDDDESVRDTAVRTLLHQARENALDIPRKPVEAALGRALDRFHIYVHARPPYPSDVRESSIVFRHDAVEMLDAEIFFLDELERRTERALSKVCDLLGLLGSPAEIYSAARELRAPTLKRRLKAVDILQEVAPREQRPRLFDLLGRYLQPRQPGPR